MALRARVGRSLALLCVAGAAGCAALVRVPPSGLAPADALPGPRLPPSIVAIAPVGVAGEGARIRIRFAEDLAAPQALEAGDHADVLAHFSLTPPLAGHFELSTPRMVSFVSDAALPHAARFDVRVSAGLRGTGGELLAHDLNWSFTTKALTFSGLPTDATPVSPLPAVAIDASEPVDVPTLLAHAHLIDASDPAREIELQVAPDAAPGGTHLVLQPIAQLAPGRRYALVIAPGVLAAGGNLPTTVSYRGALQTAPALAFTGAAMSGEPGKRFTNGEPVVSFTNPIDAASAQRAIALSPAPEAGIALLTADERGLVAFNGAALAPRTTYTVRVAGTLADRFGQTLARDAVAHFTTGDLAPAIAAPRGPHIFPPIAGLSLDVATTNLPERAYRAAYRVLAARDLIEHDPTSDAQVRALLPPPGAWPKRPFDQPLDETVDAALPLRAWLRGRPGMLAYGATARTGSPGESREPLPPGDVGTLEQTGIGVFAQWFAAGGVVIADRLSDGAPIARASVAVFRASGGGIGPGEAPCAAGTTRADGTWIVGPSAAAPCLAGGAEGAAPALLTVVRSRGDWAFARTTPAAIATTGLHGALVVDRALYHPSDTVRGALVGAVERSGTIGRAASGIFAFIARAADGRRVARATAEADGFGVVAFALALPRTAPPGDWSLEVRRNAGERLDGAFRVVSVAGDVGAPAATPSGTPAATPSDAPAATPSDAAARDAGTTIVLDRPAYAPGATAHAQVSLPAGDDEVSLLVARRAVLFATHLRVRGTTATIAIPVTSAMLPGATVEAFAVRRGPPLVAGMPPLRLAALGTARLQVTLDEKRLALRAVALHASLAPGIRQTLAFHLAAPDGAPVRGEIVLAVSRGAAQDDAPDPVPLVYAEPPSVSRTADNRDDVVLQSPHAFPSASPASPTPAPSPTPSPTPSLVIAPITAPNASDDGVYWNARVRTDRAGNARVSITLPAGAGPWHALAIAGSTDGRFGSASADFVTAAGAAGDAELPAFLRPGDRLTASGPRVRRRLTRLPLATTDVLERTVIAGTAAHSTSIPIDLSPSVHGTLGALRFAFSSSVLGDAVAPIDALQQPPVPLARVLAARIGIASDAILLARRYGRPTLVPSLRKSALRDLAALSHLTLAGGGIARWPGDARGDVGSTAFVASELAQARRAGFDADALLAAATQGLDRVPGDARTPPAQRLAALGALGAAGDARDTGIPRLVAGERALSFADRARLARILIRLDDWHGKAAALRDALFSSAPPPDDPAQTAARAQLLELAVASGLDDAGVERALAALLACRRDGRWGDETGDALALGALADYAGRDVTPPSFTVTAALPASPPKIVRASFEGSDTTLAAASLPIDEVMRGPASIELVEHGTDLLYYTAILTDQEPAFAPGAFAGLRIDRTVRVPGAAAPLAAMGLAAPATVRVAAGESYEVEDRIVADHPVDNLIVTDSLPAGFVAAAGTLEAVGPAVDPGVDRFAPSYELLGLERVIAYAVHLEPGTYAFRYVVRASAPGTYAWPAAVVTTLGAAGESGRTGSTVLEVDAP